MRIKPLLILFLCVLTASVTFSQTSYLQLSLEDDGDFACTLDNTTLGMGNFAEFENIPAGEHSLKVVRDITGALETVFDGKIKVPSGYDVYAVIDEYNSFNIYKKKKYGFNRYVPTGDLSRRCGDDGTKINEKKDDQVVVNDECRYKVMKSESFSDLKGSINNRAFESGNIATVKTAIDANYFTSEQVKEILGFFTFEDTKLDIAKYFYKKVCDKNNFFKVYDAFDFDSSIQELKNYISGK
jgi:hypothetical protein